MRYRTLGRFGAVGNPDHDSIRIIHKALDFGINVVETADRYSAGESEEIVGKALQGRRDDVVLASKVNLPIGEDPNQRATPAAGSSPRSRTRCAGCRPTTGRCGRLRTEQPPYSIVNRAIEREVLPVCQRYGMGTLIWSRWVRAC